jgi:hypothetical protein
VGRIFWIVFFSFLIVGLLQFLVSLVLNMVGLGLRSSSPGVAAQLMPYVVAVFLYPFVQVVITLLYYDLRIRKEGFDMELMAKELGFGATASPAPVTH